MESSGEPLIGQHSEKTGARRVVLSETSPLMLGELRVEPALRRVAHADGREDIVEPRVMQVLVALILAEGRILSRDELLARCWHGVVVGDDAINRVIGRLRRLIDGIGGGVFKLETITKVGFRLVRCDRIDVMTPLPPRVIDEARAPTAPLLAVLAFDNLCEEAGMTWFSDGMSEEIQQTVSRATGLRVIGRASSFQFRGADKAAGRVAAALNATHVLDGSVRRSGARVRISAELIECAGQTSLWTDRFDRDLVDIFRLQDEIASAVATALKTAFAPSIAAPTIKPEAYDLYLKAKGSFSPNNLAELAMLERVTKIEPSFAPAWALLAYRRGMIARHYNHTGVSDQDRRLIVEGATTALDLDPCAGLAFAALGVIEPYAEYAKREGRLNEALACAPNDAALWCAMTAFCASVGRFREAFDWSTKAYEIDALDPYAAYWYANELFEAGHPDRSLRLFEQSRVRWMDGDMFVAIPLLLCAYHGMWRAFDTIADRVEAAHPLSARVREALFVGAALRSPNPDVKASVRRHLNVTLAQTGTLSLSPLVFAYKLGMGDEVFDLVEKASFTHLFDPRGRSPGGWYNASIVFSGVTDMSRDPRFLGLCAKLGLCDYWVTTNRWPECAEATGLDFDFKVEARKLAAARA